MKEEYSPSVAGIAAQEALRPAGDGSSLEWRPIDSAPTDGTEILLAAGPASLGDGALLWKYGIGFYTKYKSSRLLWDWCWGFQPTHWMPLPQPPAESSAAVSPLERHARESTDEPNPEPSK